MSRIRPLEPDDVPAVASLYERVIRSGSPVPAPGLADGLRRACFEDPWHDPDIPSLVLETDGAIGAFIGVHARRVLFDGEPRRMAFTAHFMTAPELRGRPAGPLLLRRALAGPQDVTFAAGGPALGRMWRSSGGRSLIPSSVGWAHVLRPAGAVGELALERLGRKAWQRPARPVLGLADRVLAPRLLAFTEHLATRGQGAGAGGEAPATTTEPLTAAHVLEHLPALAGPARVRPDYDERFLTWLFAEMTATRARGELHRRLVRDAAGRVLGWYVTFLHPTRISRVMQVVAGERDIEPVVDALFAHATASGTPVLAGRSDPRLFATLWQRPCYLLRDPEDLIHARDERLLTAALLGEALVTPMDVEAWMGYHLSVPTGGRRAVSSPSPDVGADGASGKPPSSSP